MSVDLKDAGVVITGAGRGIGEALARRFAAEGARLVLADVDSSVEAVASSLGAQAVVGDAASEDGVEALIAAARASLGEIDMYCANAGIAPMGGAEATEDVWARTWDVNVMSHVRAARALLPAWLERGRGHFLATVSAAGLLTSLGSAPYSVTKHGALAFAEWLLATYKHRGISVQALCPQGVRTKMYEDTGAGGKLLMGDSLIEAEQVADLVVEALRGEKFLILPHPEVADYYAARATQNDRWIAGMNKLQRKVEDLD
ncbi:NAD(P)-dependent dehydrogenase (short-subunit alcohol dehydrogenase family) [Kibdelosporangium banguiense]|uniref:NAD(P)-dependent dehydrogenase (Short-subunit alcohol dehydrogenase family) n=1 Tax=Kibdelosporangium banguiense TaxID=1365924 RepID=A0ABS4TGV0_9PSEU|nr:SDR family oxidoreductase [Kibdelosporangium banguiense]MBP2323614.1 NAD(P)-dependent dehydrogenase (short-subunit alcohol dehydrogenase family) [Kibdelosporangium banguiense]